MARTTKASNAVQRLKERSKGAAYSMVSMADGRFFLTRANGTSTPEALNEPMEMDAFVAYVNSLEKQAPKKVSKLDLAFEQKLQNSKK